MTVTIMTTTMTMMTNISDEHYQTKMWRLMCLWRRLRVSSVTYLLIARHAAID